MLHERTPFVPDAAQARVLDTIAARLDRRCRVGVLTGAGISAASGVPTFRGTDGLWKNHRAEELATPEGFSRNPALAWEWYGWRRDRIAAARPNAAHHALVSLRAHVRELVVLTQNVDGLHALSVQTTPAPREDEAPEIVELHGSIWRVRCLRCGHEREDRRPGPGPGEIPHCECGGLLRPGVVWFGEALPDAAVERARATAMGCDVFLVVGTSAQVHPAVAFAAVARHHGALVAEFNLEATDLSSRVDLALHAPAELTLPALVERVRDRRAAEPAVPADPRDDLEEFLEGDYA